MTGGRVLSYVPTAEKFEQHVQARLNDKEGARADIELKKAVMLDRLVQFNEKIRAFFAGSKWLGALPSVPTPTEAQSRITDPLDDANNLWPRASGSPISRS